MGVRLPTAALVTVGFAPVVTVRFALLVAVVVVDFAVAEGFGVEEGGLVLLGMDVSVNVRL